MVKPLPKAFRQADSGAVFAGLLEGMQEKRKRRVVQQSACSHQPSPDQIRGRSKWEPNQGKQEKSLFSWISPLDLVDDATTSVPLQAQRRRWEQVKSSLTQLGGCSQFGWHRMALNIRDKRAGPTFIETSQALPFPSSSLPRPLASRHSSTHCGGHEVRTTPLTSNDHLKKRREAELQQQEPQPSQLPPLLPSPKSEQRS